MKAKRILIVTGTRVSDRTAFYSVEVNVLVNQDVWKSLTWLLNWLCDNWQLPDDGIWEVRGGRQEFLYSRVMCWVAIDRAIRLAR